MNTNKDINEFIDADGDIISGDRNHIDYTTTTHKTTDAIILMTRQPFVFQNYRRYYGEAVLPFNEMADSCKSDPKKFYEYLAEKGMEETFEDYFVEVKPRLKDVKPANEVDPKDKLKEIAKEKAYKMLETLLSKKKDNDYLISRSMPTIEEIKGKEKLLFDKFDNLIEFFKENLNEEEKKLLLSYFEKSLKNG
jgi:hypothetical protein